MCFPACSLRDLCSCDCKTGDGAGGEDAGSDVVAARELNVALEDGTPRVEDDEVAWYMVEVEHLMVQSCE